jgi:hypothetical protein
MAEKKRYKLTIEEEMDPEQAQRMKDQFSRLLRATKTKATITLEELQ